MYLMRSCISTYKDLVQRKWMTISKPTYVLHAPLPYFVWGFHRPCVVQSCSLCLENRLQLHLLALFASRLPIFNFFHFEDSFFFLSVIANRDCNASRTEDPSKTGCRAVPITSLLTKPGPCLSDPRSQTQRRLRCLPFYFSARYMEVSPE